MQKISPIPRFILEIQQILGSQDLKDHPIFITNIHKIIKITFGFPKFLSKNQKPIFSMNSFLRYSQF